MNKIVFINPGHDVELDSGAVNEELGLREADICASIGELVSERLDDNDVANIVCQSDNLAGEAGQYRYSVCAQANVNHVDLFVSIHCNSCDNEYANGTECFVYSFGGRAEYAARYIQEALVETLGTTDRGIKEADFCVLRNTFMPAVLVEVGFLSNTEEAEMLRDRQEEIAEAIAEGIIAYLHFVETHLEGAE